MSLRPPGLTPSRTFPTKLSLAPAQARCSLSSPPLHLSRSVTTSLSTIRRHDQKNHVHILHQTRCWQHMSNRNPKQSLLSETTSFVSLSCDVGHATDSARPSFAAAPEPRSFLNQGTILLQDIALQGLCRNEKAYLREKRFVVALRYPTILPVLGRRMLRLLSGFEMILG